MDEGLDLTKGLHPASRGAGAIRVVHRTTERAIVRSRIGESRFVAKNQWLLFFYDQLLASHLQLREESIAFRERGTTSACNAFSIEAVSAKSMNAKRESLFPERIMTFVMVPNCSKI